MHELSFAAAILKQLQVQEQRQPGARCACVGVRVGELSGVGVDPLMVSFEFLTKGTRWDGLALDVEYCPHRECCDACGFEFVVDEYDTACPACRGRETHCVGGEELDIAYIRLDEA